jgi:hypothetical protein
MALTDDKQRDFETWDYKQFTLASGYKAYKNAQLGLILTGADAGKVRPWTAASNLMHIGTAWRQVDATSAAKTITVRLDQGMVLEWLANGDTIAATDCGKFAYMQDDQTVKKAATNSSAVGIIRAVDSTLGVLVQKFALPMGQVGGGVGVLAAFAAGDTAPTDIADGAHYDVPTTAANSTISLPAATNYRDGHCAFFFADGTKNGHTLTFRDVATAISAATTASKRVFAIAKVFGGKWYVDVSVGP